MNDIISTPKKEAWSFLKYFILIFLFILSFHPFLKVSAQEEEEVLVKSNPEPKYILGPQLLPLSSHQESNADDLSPLLLETSCPNSDFSSGTWANWQGCYGFFDPLTWCQSIGFKELGPHPLHKIVRGPGYPDFRTCNGLVNVFPGESFSARVGDTVYNNQQHLYPKEAELKYAVSVNNDSYLFIYRYAIILQSGGHPANQQPDFRVQITDANGVLLDPICGEYNVYAQPGLPGWNTCTNDGNGNVYWKNWTTVGMDLTPYFGQTVYLNFKVRGCYYDTHYGYAYISAYCGALEIQTSLCEGQDSAILTAPPGFSYYWMAITGDPSVNGNTTASITVPSVEGASYQCTLTAQNGCSVDVLNILHYTQISTGFIQTLNCAQRPSSFLDTTWVSQNQVTAWRWFFGDPASGSSDSSHLKNPDHSFTAADDYNVTLISYSTEGCSDTVVKPVTIDSLPDVSNTSRYKIICSHDSTDITLTSNVSAVLFTWTATSTSPLIIGFSDQTTPVSYLNQHLTNNGNAIDSVIYAVVPHNATCAGDDTNFYVAVYPHPNLTNAVRVKSVCDSTFTNVILESNVDSTRYTWICTTNSPNVFGYSDNTTTPDTLINQRLWNTGFNIDTVYYHVVPHAYGCLGDTTVYKVAVYPVPDLSNTPLSKPICDSTLTGVTLTSNVAGTTFTWTCTPSSGNITGCSNNNIGTTILNQRLDNTGPNIESVTYHIVPNANGCNGHTTNFIVTVNPTPHLANPVPAPICSASPFNVTLISDVAGAGFTWTASCNPVGSVTGFTNPQVTNMTVIADVLTNITNNFATVTYHITPHANGCDGPVRDFTVQVNPTPHLTNAVPLPICSATLFNVTLVPDVAGGNFTWTASCNPVGSVTGFTNPQVTNVTVISDILTNTTSNVATVTYQITPFANGCQGNTVSYSVMVNPTPHLTNSSPPPVCSGSVFNVNLTMDVNNPVNAYFEWTASCSPPGAASGFPLTLITGSSINDVLTNYIDADATVTYNITPYANNCQGQASNYSVIVHPVASVNSLNPQIICSGALTQAVPLSSNVITLTVDYAWTVICDNGIPICPGAGSGNPIPPTAISNTDLAPRYASYTITPSVAGCQGTQATYQVQINPSPTVTTSPLLQEICSGTVSTLVVLEANVNGTSFAWTATPSSGAIFGYQTAPGSGNIPAQTIYNSSSAQGYVNYHIIPSSQSGMPCPGAPADYKIYVNPLPTPLISGPQQVCYDQSGTVYSTPFIANHDYLWTVTGAVSFTGNNTYSITVDWGPGPSGTVQLIEVDQSQTTNCSTPTPVYNVIINPSPTPVITGPDSPCGNSQATYTLGLPQPNYTYSWTIIGGTPTFGTNSSITVNLGNTNPVSVGVIEYITYAPGVICSASATKTVTLNLIPDPAGTISGPSTVCQTLSKFYTITPINNADSYTWWYVPSTGVTITNNGASAEVAFDLTAGSGSLFVQGIKTGCGAGLQSPAFPITVNTLPDVSFTICFDQVTTKNAKPFMLKGGIPLGGQYQGSSGITYDAVTGKYWFDPSSAAVGTHMITYYSQNSYGCSKTSSPVSITVLPSNVTFPCGTDFTDPREAKQYPTVKIGTQCWMAANLNYGTFIASTQMQRDNCVFEKYCYTDNLTNCTTYGGLYQWDELMQYDNAAAAQGFCPPGWHVPTENEWTTLFNFYISNGFAGSPLKSTGYSGYNAFLSGTRFNNVNFYFSNFAVMFWSSTSHGPTKAWAHGMNTFNPSVSYYPSSRSNAFFARCLKD